MPRFFKRIFSGSPKNFFGLKLSRKNPADRLLRKIDSWLCPGFLADKLLRNDNGARKQFSPQSFFRLYMGEEIFRREVEMKAPVVAGCIHMGSQPLVEAVHERAI